MPLKISNKLQPPTISAVEIPEGGVKLSILGDIGDEWGGINSTEWQVIYQNGINDETPFIDVEINTNGGSTTHGVAIYNFLKNHPARIRTKILGGAHSAGSMIFLAGDERIMPSGTSSLIHFPWTCGCGDYNEVQKLANNLESFAESIVDIYLDNMNVERDDLIQMLKDEEVLFGQRALDLGFATSLVAESENVDQEDFESRVREARTQVSSSRTCFLLGNDGDTMSDTTKKRSRSGDEPSVDVLQAKVDLLTNEKDQIAGKHDVVSALNDTLIQKVKDLEAQLEEATNSKVDESEIREEIKAEVVAEMKDSEDVKSRASSIGVDVKSEVADEMMKEVIAEKGVKNAESFAGESLKSMFDFVVDQYSSDDADDVYSSSVDSDVEGDDKVTADPFASVNSKMKKGA